MNTKYLLLFFLLLTSIYLAFNPAAPEVSNLSSALNNTSSLINDLFGQTSTTTDFFDWKTLSFMGIFISLMVSLLLYMSSKFLNSTTLRYYARMNTQDALAATFILMVLVFLVPILDIIVSQGGQLVSTVDTCSSVVPGTNCPILLDLSYLEDIQGGILTKMNAYLTEYFQGSRLAGSSAVLGLDFVLAGWPEFTYSYGGSTGINKRGSLARLLLISKALPHLKNLYAFSNAVYIIFRTFVIPLSLLFIPLGVFLRSLYFTKRWGATTLAVGIGGYIIFPIVLMFILMLSGHIQSTALYSSNGQPCPAICSNPSPIAFIDSSPPTPASPSMLLNNLTKACKSTLDNNESITTCPKYEEYKNFTLGKKAEITLDTTFKSCINLSWHSWSSTSTPPEIPATCKVVPYPSNIPACRKYSNYSYKLFDLTDGACFMKLFSDGTDLSAFNRTVEVIDLTSSGMLKRSETPAFCAMKTYKCVVFLPVHPPNDLQLVEYDSSAGTWKDKKYKKQENKYYCPSMYRYALIKYNETAGNYTIVFPGREIETHGDPSLENIKNGCDSFYNNAVGNITKAATISMAILDGEHYYARIDSSTNTITIDKDSTIDSNYDYDGSSYSDMCPSGALNYTLASEATQTYIDEMKSIQLALPLYLLHNCGHILTLTQEVISFPPSYGCENCITHTVKPLSSSLHSSIEGLNFITNMYINVYLLPLLALVLTGPIIKGLSQYLGGEMFIPALSKVI